MQSVSSRIWTRVAVSISFDDNHYNTGTSIDGTLTDITTPCLSGHRSNGNEGVLHTAQISRIRTLLSYAI